MSNRQTTGSDQFLQLSVRGITECRRLYKVENHEGSDKGRNVYQIDDSSQEVAPLQLPIHALLDTGFRPYGSEWSYATLALSGVL
jgi:hypothetical protein